MNTPDPAVVERIRKLLRLARDSGASEAEAALAAEKAQALLEEHQLSLADADPDATGAGPQPIGRGVYPWATHYRWGRILMRAVADTSGTFAVSTEQGFVLFGEPAALVLTGELFGFLAEQVERFAAQHANGRARLAFKLGCAGRVGERLREAFKARQSERSESRALVIVTAQDRATQEAHAQMQLKAPTRAVSRLRVNGEAYNAGREAGDRVRTSLERKLGGGPTGLLS